MSSIAGDHEAAPERDDARRLTPPITPGQFDRLRAVWAPPRGLRYLAEINNSVIGMYYLVTALGFLLAGGALAILIRLQLAVPDNDLLSPDLYNQVSRCTARR
jgi:hypothetical protein